MTYVYEPSKSLSARISRRLTPYFGRRTRRFTLERPIVSFTFDDCPVSAIENGVSLTEAEGWLSTIYVASGLLGQINHHGQQINGDDVKALHANGHEIGGHTFSHIDAQAFSITKFLEDIDANQHALDKIGVPESRTFAYPFGQVSSGLKSELEGRFTAMRGIQPGVHKGSVDLNQVKSVALFSGQKLDLASSIIKGLSGTSSWVTLFTHDVRESHSDWGCSPSEMKTIIEQVKQSGAQVMTVAEAVEHIEASCD